ncbi:hypothetical protein [uncultured Tenacibaculum sp.]|uniref:hypothetical protein n=1 Tax=uncultured Tenacibaculum sp. TaxID=174713 RepID=UPI0026192394|nr:hypothetical protein [uncultured Tenacibaculum sp.]
MSLNINNLIDSNLRLVEKLTKKRNSSTSIWRFIGLDNKELSDVYECNKLGDKMETESLIIREREIIHSLTKKGKRVLENGGWLKYLSLKTENKIPELADS